MKSMGADPQRLNREECLTILEEAIKSPPGDSSLRRWVMDNLDALEAVFDRRDFLKLKRRGRLGARQVLERYGRIEPSIVDDMLAASSESHCLKCGEELFRAVPGKTTRKEIVAFAERSGSETIKAEGWIHPGVYCPNGCVCVLFNDRRVSADADSGDSSADGE